MFWGCGELAHQWQQRRRQFLVVFHLVGKYRFTNLGPKLEIHFFGKVIFWKSLHFDDYGPKHEPCPKLMLPTVVFDSFNPVPRGFSKRKHIFPGIVVQYSMYLVYQPNRSLWGVCLHIYEFANLFDRWCLLMLPYVSSSLQTKYSTWKPCKCNW